MFGVLKAVLGMEGEGADSRRERFIGLTSELERALFCKESCQHGEVVETASQLRNMLRQEDLQLSREEKVGLVKAINKAKVRALLGGTTECYRTFVSLDSISSDMLHLL